jgi:hypothetical protein
MWRMRTKGATSFTSVRLVDINAFLNHDPDNPNTVAVIPVSRKWAEINGIPSTEMRGDRDTIKAMAPIAVKEIDFNE